MSTTASQSTYASETTERPAPSGFLSVWNQFMERVLRSIAAMRQARIDRMNRTAMVNLNEHLLRDIGEYRAARFERMPRL